MVPTGRLVKVSFYIIDLRVMSVFPLSPLLSICACTQLVSWQGFSHLPYMLYDLRSGNRALDSHPRHRCTFFIPQKIRICFCASTILKRSESSQSVHKATITLVISVTRKIVNLGSVRERECHFLLQ